MTFKSGLFDIIHVVGGIRRHLIWENAKTTMKNEPGSVGAHCPLRVLIQEKWLSVHLPDF